MYYSSRAKFFGERKERKKCVFSIYYKSSVCESTVSASKLRYSIGTCGIGDSKSHLIESHRCRNWIASYRDSFVTIHQPEDKRWRRVDQIRSSARISLSASFSRRKSIGIREIRRVWSSLDEVRIYRRRYIIVTMGIKGRVAPPRKRVRAIDYLRQIAA